MSSPHQSAFDKLSILREAFNDHFNSITLILLPLTFSLYIILFSSKYLSLFEIDLPLYVIFFFLSLVRI